jgi:hypothetical protein
MRGLDEANVEVAERMMGGHLPRVSVDAHDFNRFRFQRSRRSPKFFRAVLPLTLEFCPTLPASRTLPVEHVVGVLSKKNEVHPAVSIFLPLE